MRDRLTGRIHIARPKFLSTVTFNEVSDGTFLPHKALKEKGISGPRAYSLRDRGFLSLPNVRHQWERGDVVNILVEISDRNGVFTSRGMSSKS